MNIRDPQVVIHNALDIQPKGDSIYHPGTVEIEVLPPIDTSTWTAGNIGDRVEEVRKLFLKVLGQEEKPEKPKAAKKGKTRKQPAEKRR